MPQHDDDYPADDSGAGSALGALSAFAPAIAHDDGGEESALGALSAFAPDEPEDTESELDAVRSQTEASDEVDEAEEDAGQLFTVTNPPRTVAVSALLDGRIERVHLSADAANMSGSQLAEEILVLADLARQKALAGQHTFLLENPDLSEFTGETEATREEDIAAGRDFLENEIGLVSPQQAVAAQAEVFATRYRHDYG